MRKVLLSACFTIVTSLTTTPVVYAQKDPGPRSGAAAAGGALPGVTSSELAYFLEGKNRFQEIDSVLGTQPGTNGSGLGPRFNSNSCASCHAQPSTGGSSPASNPQIAVGTAFGAKNQIPQFIQANGPVREARFARNADGSPDGGVHDVFVITGRGDAGWDDGAGAAAVCACFSSRLCCM